MSKKPIQDVIPPSEKRSIRNIKLPERPATEKVTLTSSEVVRTNTPSRMQTGEVSKNLGKEGAPSINKEFLTIPSVSSGGRSSRMFKVAVMGGFLVAAALVYLGYLFLHVGAVVNITPKTKEVSVRGLYSAKKNPKPQDLAFEVISLEEENSKTVPSTGEKKVETRATGKVIIYNDYSTQSQRLVKNTRLQTAEGLVFRIDSSVVVPGQSKKDGKTVPGSIETSVSADTAGDEYNISLSDFTIPGFKGDPRYEKFYARSKTSMSGGFKGTIKTASTKDLSAAKEELSVSLKESLVQKAKEQIPNGFILYDSAIYVTYESLSQKDTNEVKLKASLHGIIFNKDNLASFISRQTITSFNNEAVTSENLNNLEFKPDSLEIAPWQTGNLPFSLNGTTTILWLIDKEKMQKDLTGVAKNEVETVFRSYPGIERAQVELSPAWKSTLPEESDKIEIVVKKVTA